MLLGIYSMMMYMCMMMMYVYKHSQCNCGYNRFLSSLIYIVFIKIRKTIYIIGASLSEPHTSRVVAVS